MPNYTEGTKQNRPTSNILKLREWLTVPETARHLSLMIGEEVTKADVLRLALDRHLKLSVNFVNHAHARRGDIFLPLYEWETKFRKIATWQNAKVSATINGAIAVDFSGFDIIFYLKDDELNKGNKQWHLRNDEALKTALLNKLSPEFQAEFLSGCIEQAIIQQQKQSEKFGGKVPPSIQSFWGKVLTIKGVWDLPMLGAECLDIEHEYQMLTNGPEITLTVLDGAFVEREDGVIFQVQESFDKKWIDYQNSEENKQKSLDFYRKALDKRIADNEIDEKEAEKLLDQRKKNLDRPRGYEDNFFPAGGLPKDSVLVVRTKALLDLQSRLSSEEPDDEILEANQKRELGRLRTEKSKWDDSIQITFKVGAYCCELEDKGKKITRDMLTDYIIQQGYKDLPKTTIDKIWKTIPEKYRKKAGRPQIK